MRRVLFPVLAAFMLCILCGQSVAQCGPGGCTMPGGPITWGESPDGQLVQPIAPPPSSRRPPGRELVPVAPPARPPLPEGALDPVEYAYYSLVKITAGDTGGSGTYLGGGLVISCEHVVRGKSRAEVQFTTGETIVGSVMAQDRGLDLALIDIGDKAPATALGVPIATEPVKIGQRIWVCGWGSERRLAITLGQVTAVKQITTAVMPNGSDLKTRYTDEAIGAAISGDSGGAWLDDDGRLRGVVWGGRPGMSSATTEYTGWLQNICDRNRRTFPPPAVPPSPPVDLEPIKKAIAEVRDMTTKITAKQDEIGIRLANIDVRVTKLETPPEPAEKPKQDSTVALIVAGIVSGILALLLTSGLFFVTGGGNTI